MVDPAINNQENQPLDNGGITARASFVDYFAQLLQAFYNTVKSKSEHTPNLI